MRVFTEEHKRKISEALKGHGFSKETLLKMSLAKKGFKGYSGKDNPMYGKTGSLNPMWGRKHSKETKAKISQTSIGRWLGKKHKESSKIKASNTHKKLVELGIHPSWKGGRTSQTMIIRASREYRQWRTNVFERDNYTCINCGARNGKGKKAVFLNADHIKSFSRYPGLRFNTENGRTLCVECHKKTPNYGYKAVLEDGGGAHEFQSST